MDLKFETQKGEKFTMEIGYFDTVLEVKEKIEKYKKIPISKQTLVYNGKILEDSGDVESCVLLHNSYVRLIVAPIHEDNNNNNNNNKPKSPEKLKLQQQQQQQQQQLPGNHEDPLLLQIFSHPVKKTRIILRLPSPKSSASAQKLGIDVDLNDSVEHLKKKLYQIEGFPAHQQALFLSKSIELKDNRHLREYEIKDGCEIDVLLKQSSAPKPSSGMKNTMLTTSSKKLQVIVLPKCGTKKFMLEVNPMEKVQALRNELEKLQQQDRKFKLPSEGYFFIYKHNVMEEKETFQWHNVRQHDTIEIFNGSITGGS
ncbi:hypothetical protein SOVF_070040 [Spinacia oleracea]|uniref:Ubiquitin domain-containing protein 7SL RNA2-like n=1 Tax=Spinacia oleracea TaxID=3562 RepID=A0A9R0HT65_SPIOL|nr:ubiquitin domain-containing protein 7SL RNA2-like [Spinacia oleracea]KNA18520.1 hypothetical protein SOVF_070040 [Spinacia oleracea]